MKFIRIALTLALIVVSGACEARFPRGGGTGAAAAVGKANLNLGQGELLTSQASTSVFLAAQQMSFNAGATPGALDAFMFPVRNFSGSIGATIPGTLPSTGPYIFAWDAGRSCFRWSVLKSATEVSHTNATITNGAGGGNFTVEGVCGQAGSVTFNWNNTSGASWSFDGTYTQYNSNTTGRMWMSRSSNVGWNGQSDAVAFATSGIYWSKEYVDEIAALHPESLRPMGWNILSILGVPATNVVNWGYRRTTSALSFFNDSDYPPGVRCGGTTSLCTATVSNGAVTSAAAADTSLAGWPDGEQLAVNLGSTLSELAATVISNNVGKCQFTVPSTTGLSPGNPVATFGGTVCNTQATTILTVDSPTQFTTNQASNGTCSSSFCVAVGYQTLIVTGKPGGNDRKLIVGTNGVPIASPIASGLSLFTYNATLDKVLVTAGGVSNTVPLEAQVQLANLVNTNLWYNFPTWANDGFVTNAANTIYSGLNTNLKAIFELGNEFFNFGQYGARYSIEMGTALGITTNNSWTWQGLRNRQIFGNLLPASSWSAAVSRMDRAFCTQAGGDFQPIVDAMAGASLVSPGTFAYQTYVGGIAVNYNTSPNRPIDFTQSICYAPYTGGGTALSEAAPDAHVFPTADNAALLNAIGAAVVGSPATANALIDQSIRGDYLNRVNDVTASTTTFTTRSGGSPTAHNFAVGDIIRFKVTGGTTYSGLDVSFAYKILSTPTSSTFTAGKCVAMVVAGAVNAGSAGSGTTTVGYLDTDAQVGRCFANHSIFGMASGPRTNFQLIATTGFSPTPAGGTPNVREYEDSLEPMPPSVSTCSSIGVTTSYCGPAGDIAVGIDNWKNSSFASATIQYDFMAFKGTASGLATTGTVPNSTYPSWLVLNGGEVYALTNGSDLVSPSYRQLYFGFQAFSAP